MGPWKLFGWSVTLIVEILLLAGVVVWEAKAEIDPHIPVPAIGYCPGGLGSPGGAGFQCDGRPFPDGTFWRVTNIPGVGFVLTCEGPGGIAGPGGCEGKW